MAQPMRKLALRNGKENTKTMAFGNDFDHLFMATLGMVNLYVYHMNLQLLIYFTRPCNTAEMSHPGTQAGPGTYFIVLPPGMPGEKTSRATLGSILNGSEWEN